MRLYEKYREYLVDNTMPGHPTRWFHLTAPGWRLLISENITPIIEQRLQLRQIGDYIWANEYENGKRKVLSLFKINDAYATFQWGWNFDFVPKGKNAAWARTDKSICTHIFEVSEDFYNTGPDHDPIKRLKRDKTVIGRLLIDAKNPERSLEERIRQHKQVFNHLLPLITKYYAATASYEGILKRIDYNMKDGWQRFVNGGNLMTTQAFVEKRVGLEEKALQDFEAIMFVNEDIKQAYFKKFNQIGEA